MRWPIGIATALFVFVCVQMGFVWLSVTHKDDVVESYKTEPR